MLIQRLILLVESQCKWTHHRWRALERHWPLQTPHTHWFLHHCLTLHKCNNTLSLERICGEGVVEVIGGVLTLEFPVKEVKEDCGLQTHFIFDMDYTEQNQIQQEYSKICVVFTLSSHHCLQFLERTTQFFSEEILPICIPHGPSSIEF